MRYDDDFETDLEGAYFGLRDAKQPEKEKPVYRPMSWLNYWAIIVVSVVLVIMRFACG